MSGPPDGVPRDIAAFAECWNRAEFFAAHEILEVRWTYERDNGLQGLIQLAAAMHHLSNGNLRGAKTMLERAIIRLRDESNAPCELDLEALAGYAQRAKAALERISAADVIGERPKL